MFGILFLAVFIFGIASIAGLIVGIIGLATGKKNMTLTGFIGFGLGLILTVAGIIYSVNRAVHKVKEFAENSIHSLDSLEHSRYEDGYEDPTEDVRSYLLDDTSTNATMKFIRESSAKKDLFVQDSYYTYFGTTSSARFPVIYPFAIHCWDTKDFGTLVNEEQVTDIRYNPGKEENVIFNIHRFAFDDKYILMKTATVQGDTSSAVYMLYDMDKKTSELFETEERMLKTANKAGYKGGQKLISLWDYDKKF